MKQARNPNNTNTETSYSKNDRYASGNLSPALAPIYRRFQTEANIFLNNINEDESKIGEWLANEEASLEQITLRYPDPKLQDPSDNQVLQSG
jgi:hypothetical protein